MQDELSSLASLAQCEGNSYLLQYYFHANRNSAPHLERKPFTDDEHKPEASPAIEVLRVT